MIDGLKVMVTGDELQTLLAQRMEQHQRCAERWRHQRDRRPEEQTDEQPGLPEHMCAYEAERHEWRADILGFIRDHIDASEVYRLGEADLAFGELLAEGPAPDAGFGMDAGIPLTDPARES